MRIAFFLMVATLFLSACSSTGRSAPSLAKRGYELSDADIERLMAGEVEITEAATPTAVPLAPALEQQVEAAVADNSAGQSAFQRKFAATERLVNEARGAAPDSEKWAQAQMAVSRLDAARAPSVSAIGALDSLYIATFDSLGAESAQSIDIRRQPVAEDVAYQSRVVAALASSLR